MQMATSKFETLLRFLSCKLKFVHILIQHLLIKLKFQTRHSHLQLQKRSYHGQTLANMGRVFNPRYVYTACTEGITSKKAYIKVENSAKATIRFSSICFHAHKSCSQKYLVNLLQKVFTGLLALGLDNKHLTWHGLSSFFVRKNIDEKGFISLSIA